MQGVGGTNASNSTAIWSEVAPEDLRFVARQGDPVPGVDYRFGEVEPGENLQMSGGGSTYFIAGIGKAGPGNGSSGIFRFSPTGDFEFLAASSSVGSGVPVAGGPGEYFSNFLDFNERGDIAMQTGSGFGPLWNLDSSGVTMVASAGSFPTINENGDIAHRVTGNNFVDRIVVWNRNSGIARTVAEENTIAPDTAGAVFSNLGLENSFTNTSGTVTFTSRLAGAQAWMNRIIMEFGPRAFLAVPSGWICEKANQR